MRTLAITSGKGGVGKTNLSCNLGIQLAQRGQRVLIFDADLGLANVDVVLGIHAEYNLSHVVSGERKLSQVITPGPGGVHFIAGGSGLEALVGLSGEQLDNFLSELADLERKTDWLIFDTGAGIDSSVLTFLQASDQTLLVATPDPASVTDAYAIAKALWARRPDARIKVVLNMVNDEAHAQTVFTKLRAITEQFLGHTLEYGGFVRMDPQALEWIRKRRPFSLNAPNLRASQDVARLAASLIGPELTVVAEKQKESGSLLDKLRNAFAFKKSA